MPEFLDDLEKAELHVHLEGSVDFDMLCQLAPHLNPSEIRHACTFHDFPGFIEAYKFVSRLLTTPQDYALITRRLLERLHEQQVRYVEINLSVGVMLWKNQQVAPIFDAVSYAARESPVKVNWIFDAVRQFGPDQALRVAELAAERLREGVVGFGMGGDEGCESARSFAPAFDLARRRGLHLVPHAGETTTAESVWDALRLGAERIGHGIRAADDPALLRHLRDRDIPLEICITSNIRTGAVAALEGHPIRRIFDAGVPVTINTDDPGLFETTLKREYEIAVKQFRFSESQMREIAENGFRYAFGAAR
jgi:adenosine deaminase/aminodeoxyfutalosine deaminase